LGESKHGIEELCRMLTENCVLKKLNLSGNLITDKVSELLIQALDVYFLNIFSKKLLFNILQLINLIYYFF
jgi:hypothetical protein